MILMGLLISWVVLRYAGAASRWPGDAWLLELQQWAQRRVEPLLGERLAFATVLLLPALALSLVINLFGHWLFGLVGLVVSIYVLVYACGREDYDAMMLVPASGEDDGDSRKRAYASYDRWFSVACWFVLLGPVGALFYRCVSLSAQVRSGAEVKDVSLVHDARSLLGWLDWLPARLWSALFLLAGDFSRAQPVYTEQLLQTGPNDQLIDEVSQAALGEANGSSATADGATSGDETAAIAEQQQRDRLSGLNDRVMWLSLALLLLIIFVF